jgi:hypothetical protein
LRPKGDCFTKKHLVTLAAISCFHRQSIVVHSKTYLHIIQPFWTWKNFFGMPIAVGQFQLMWRSHRDLQKKFWTPEFEH